MNRRQTRAHWRSRMRAESGHSTSLGRESSLALSKPIAGISVRIEELRLQSFSQRDGRRIADALQHELSSLLAVGSVPGAWMHSRTTEKTRLNDIRIRAGAKPQAIGEELARALLRAGDGSQTR